MSRMLNFLANLFVNRQFKGYNFVTSFSTKSDLYVLSCLSFGLMHLFQQVFYSGLSLLAFDCPKTLPAHKQIFVFLPSLQLVRHWRSYTTMLQPASFIGLLALLCRSTEREDITLGLHYCSWMSEMKVTT